MSLMQDLRDLGADPDAGVKRMGGNSALYERMIKKLKDMLKESPVGMDFDCNNYDDMIEAAHAIKGAAGNLSVTPIYEAYSKFVDLLRGQQPEEAKKILEKVLPVQKEFIECIEKYS